MRVTGGLARGRRLRGPTSGTRSPSGFRPTCDRVREALFNILGDRTRGAAVLDLFAGTGALGLEALSRGAASALFVDASPESGRLVAENLRRCFPDASALQAGFLHLRLDASSSLARLAERLSRPFDLVFLDPPYRTNLALETLSALASSDILAPEALVIAEEHRSAALPERVGALVLTDRRRYGESGLWFFAASPPV